MEIETRFVGSCCDKNDTVLGKNCEELETLGQKKKKTSWVFWVSRVVVGQWKIMPRAVQRMEGLWCHRGGLKIPRRIPKSSFLYVEVRLRSFLSARAEESDSAVIEKRPALVREILLGSISPGSSWQKLWASGGKAEFQAGCWTW